MPLTNQTYASLIYTTTESYLEDMDMENHPSPETMEMELLAATNDAIRSYNNGAPDDDGNFPDKLKGDERYKLLKTLHPVQIAMCMVKVDGAIRIAMSGLGSDPMYDVVALYQDMGDDEGIYLTSEAELKRKVRRYNPCVMANEFKEVMSALQDLTTRRERCSDRDLIPVNNGIFDYKNKILLPFDPEYVFTSKSHVDYQTNAPNPHITMPDGEDWDVESWMESLSDDRDVTSLLWHAMGAMVRPSVPWNKCIFLYSEQGNNGKGTWCTAARNLCGEGTYASIPLADFGKDFLLEPLVGASTVIVDENDVGTYVDSARCFKAAVTGDPISINRKFRSPIIHVFRGVMVQCVNDIPKFKDHSDSMFRRWLPIPMMKNFEGAERKYIKDEYLHRDDVLQYMLWKVLCGLPDYYELEEPEVCKELKDEFKTVNDPVRQFMDEVDRCAAWNLLPYSYLYTLYQHWSKVSNPSGKVLNKTNFLRELDKRVDDYTYGGQPKWIRTKAPVSANGRMDYPEPMILQYNVEEWMNWSYHGMDLYRKATPMVLGNKYRGLLRNENVPIPDITRGDPDADVSDDEGQGGFQVSVTR